MDRIRISGPWITQREIDYVADAAANAWYARANEYNQRFETAFARYVGTRFAVSLPSATSAIHLSLMALGIGAGDEVIVPEATWIASAAPITYVGATTVFADIDPTTWCMSAEQLEACITNRTKAVVSVDLYGGVPDYDSIHEVAHRHGIAVIEDAAQAIGSEYRGRRAGSFGATGVFSFHGSKTLTTGEGGMLVTDDEAVLQRVQMLRDHGRKPGDPMFWNLEVGYKYKMSSLQAALGLAQLERIDELVARKRQIFSWYDEQLAGLAELTLNAEPQDTRNSFWMVTVIVRAEKGLRKEELIRHFGEHGVDCRPFFHPLSSLPAFAGHPGAASARTRNRIAYALAPFGVNLPSGMDMTVDKVRYVCTVLKELLDASPRTRD
jgi:perosamine synthetase